MNRLFVMCGLAFSGKSTLALALAERLGAAVVTLDEINRERGLPHGGLGLPVEAWAETHRIGLERLAAPMRRGGDVVADDTACFRFLRDDYRRLAAAHGYAAVLVVVDTPIAEIAARRLHDRATAAREPIAEEVFAAHAAAFEWPGDDEPAVRLRDAAAAEAWLATLGGATGG